MSNKNNTGKNSSGASGGKPISVKITKTTAIILIVVLLLVLLACVTLYFGFPDVWADFIAFFNNEPPPAGDLDGKLVFADGDLSVHYLNVGQGDCIFILFPDGKEMVIDCANYNNTSSIRSAAFDYLDTYIDDGQIDYLMLTHCDSDHVYFMDEVLEAYQVDNIFMPNVLASHQKVTDAAIPQTKLDVFTDPDTIDTATYADFFIAALTEPDCEVTLNVDPNEATNSIILTGNGIYSYTFTFYCPTQSYYDSSNMSTAEKKNAISPIGILEYNGFRLVFTGDSNEINEPVFVSRIGGYLDCDVLKVGHHGSETSSTSEFLAAINCEYAVISCNIKGNTFNHPRQNTLDRFAARKMTVYRTDNNGNIVVKVNATLSFYVQTKVEQSVNLSGYTGK